MAFQPQFNMPANPAGPQMNNQMQAGGPQMAQGGRMSMPPPQVIPPKRIKLKLENKERGFYSNMWTTANANNESKLGGAAAVNFFKGSGLDMQKLKEIWLIAAQTSPEAVNKEEFYVALRLIAYTQNGIAANAESIAFEIQVGLPKFEDAPLAIMPTQAQPQQQPQMAAPIKQIADALPDDFDNLDFSNPSAMQSSIVQPPVQQQPPPVQHHPNQMQQQYQTPSPRNQMPNEQQLEKMKQQIWYVKDDEKIQYTKYFEMFDSNKSGTLSISEMQTVFAQTKLPRDVCAKVWDLTNPDSAEVFSKPMFMMAMHFLYKRRQDESIVMPSTLPIEMVYSVTGKAPGQPGPSVQQIPQPVQNLGPPVMPSMSESNALDNMRPPSPQQHFSLGLSPRNSPIQAEKQASAEKITQSFSQFSMGGSSPMNQNQMPNKHQSMPQPQISQDFTSTAQATASYDNDDQFIKLQIEKRTSDVAFLEKVHAQNEGTQNHMRSANSKLQAQLDSLNQRYHKLENDISGQQRMLDDEKARNNSLIGQVQNKTSQLNSLQDQSLNVMQQRLSENSNSTRQSEPASVYVAPKSPQTSSYDQYDQAKTSPYQAPADSYQQDQYKPQDYTQAQDNYDSYNAKYDPNAEYSNNPPADNTGNDQHAAQGSTSYNYKDYM